MIRSIVFVQSIPILGTGKREDRFEAPEWEITVVPEGIMLRRPAQQNVPEVPMFGVVGVGYCIAGEEDDTSGSSGSKAAEAPAGNPADAGATPAPTTGPNLAAENIAQTRRRKGKR